MGFWGFYYFVRFVDRVWVMRLTGQQVVVGWVKVSEDWADEFLLWAWKVYGSGLVYIRIQQ